ncbi:MAG TPA: transposase [Ktedonobacteraceae bacterium]|nr:transposase [Ktedonobacteraceae bacterium]
MALSRTSKPWKTRAFVPMCPCRIGKSSMRSGRPPTSAMTHRPISIAVSKARSCSAWGRSLPTGVSTTRAAASICNACPVKEQCTTSTQGRRLYRQVGEEYLERVRSYQHTLAYQKALRKRQVWVEPLFAEAKDWHGLQRFRLRLLWRVNIEALCIAAGQNLKRLLKKRGWGRRPFPIYALCVPFLAAFGCFARPSLRYLSVSSFLVSHCPMNKIEHLPSY